MAPPNYHPDGEYSQWYAPPHSPTAADSQPQAVTITLRSTRPTTFQTRNIILRPDEPVNIGRSSRSEAKNLSATPDNALFDCPVISRRHAELELKVNKWTEEKHTVFIRDTGSMHGTSVNGQKLVPTRPFQLKEGDTIRLGESVNRADSECRHARIPFPFSLAYTTTDNYDGVTVTLHCISTATKKTTAQVKNTQQGISVPSDSESEFDDDDEDSDGGADLHPSSVHTTPDQGNAKPGLQPPVQVGSSRSNVITVEDDDDDEPVPLYTRRVQGQTGFNTYISDPDSLITRRVPAQPAFVPDTYADDSVMAADPHAAPAPHSSLQFDESYAALEESEDAKAAMAIAETAPTADEGFDHEDVNSEEGDDARSHAWSDEDHFSDEGQDSDGHSVSYEDFDRQSFLSEEFNMSDDAAVEDDEDDEGPEVMSSKRRLSNELGTLGDEPDHALSKSTRLYPLAPRPHYDPVRGCEVPAPSVDKASTYRSYGTLSGNPFHDMFADPGHSNKWDVGPASTSEAQEVHNYSFFGQSYPPHVPMTSNVMSNSFDLNPVNNVHETFSSLVANTGFPPGATLLPPSSVAFFANETTRSPAFPPAADYGIFDESNNTKKRKASEISTSEEPVTTTQAPTSSEVVETANVADASTNTVATAVAPAEPQPKKRKTKQPHSQKSMLRTAIIEAGKYTAGAIIGGIGLVTILASPIGEALASC
jgi:pSer/pThr/pTyr-binding forkhead associated (FHA) protein